MMIIGIIFPEYLSVIGKYNLLVFTMLCLCSCHFVKRQQENLKYDSLTQQNVYTFVEKMPTYKGGDRAFLNDFGKYFRYDHSHLNIYEDIQTKLYFQFVIDTKGHLIGARIYNREMDKLTAFEKAGLEALYLMQDWQSGEHNGKSVNVLIKIMIHIDFNNK